MGVYWAAGQQFVGSREPIHPSIGGYRHPGVGFGDGSRRPAWEATSLPPKPKTDPLL
jgi:hypothetical protein